MFKTVLLLLVAAAALTAGNPTNSQVPVRPLVRGTHVVKNCGQTNVNTERIVGGNEAVPHAYPWQVSLHIDDSYFCGGTIISEEWVLASAVCLSGARKVEVLAGAHDTSLVEPSQLRVVSTTIIVHEAFEASTYRNDIALIQMEPITFTPEIAAVCLPNYSDVPLPTGTEVTITGWGATAGDFPYMTNKLQVVIRPALSTADCQVVYGNYVTDSMICADTTGGHGICTGDSGGPMTAPGTCGNPDCVAIRGIASWFSAEGCDSGYPHGFTRTHAYLDWIEAATGIAIGE